MVHKNGKQRPAFQGVHVNKHTIQLISMGSDFNQTDYFADLNYFAITINKKYII